MLLCGEGLRFFCGICYRKGVSFGYGYRCSKGVSCGSSIICGEGGVYGNGFTYGIGVTCGKGITCGKGVTCGKVVRCGGGIGNRGSSVDLGKDSKVKIGGNRATSRRGIRRASNHVFYDDRVYLLGRNRRRT